MTTPKKRRGRPPRADGLKPGSEATYEARGLARLFLRVPVAIVEALDAMRGTRSRSGVVAELVREAGKKKAPRRIP